MSIPNGNLYKFMAIFGLLLFFACVLLPYLKLGDSIRETNQIRRSLVVLSHEREALVSKIKDFEKRSFSNDSSTVASINLLRNKNQVAEWKEGIDLRTEQISLENEILAEQIKKQSNIKSFMGYFIIISFLITLIGFLAWYFKLQRPLNRSIKRELYKEQS